MGFQELIIEIDEGNHDDFLENELAVLHFFSDCQMNCLTTMPLIEDVAQEFSDHNIAFGNVNIDELGEIAHGYNISRVPVVIFFRNGEQIDRLEQIQEDILREKISSLLQVC